MEADEAGTLAALKSRRKEVLEPLVAKHQGRVFKVTGDGVLVEFASAVNAVQCAVDLQQAFANANEVAPDDRHIVLRIGVNLGDVMVEGGDLYGDGINIAARLEALAEPGGILISGTAHDHVGTKVKVGFDDIGPQTLKNIAQPVRAYRVTDMPAVAVATTKPISDKPSIAVLPFTNMSGDPEQEYFSDGVSEEIISGLARIHWLFVIARNSSFTFKGKAVDVKQIGGQLGVRYVLEGSVRKSGDRVRITSQLIDAGAGTHIWTDRFDGLLSDIFDLQDKVTARVVGAIGPKLRHAEIARARAKPTENVGAYDLFLRALALHNSLTAEGNDEAIRLLTRAVEIDPDYASAYGLAAFCYLRKLQRGWVAPTPELTDQVVRAAQMAAEKGQDDAEALWMAGLVLSMLTRDSDDGPALIEQSLLLNPNSASAWRARGIVRAYRGHRDLAIADLERSMQLSPLDSQAYQTWYGIAVAHFSEERYDLATEWVDRTLRAAPNYVIAVRLKAAMCGLLGHLEEGGRWVAHLRALSRSATLSDTITNLPSGIRANKYFAPLIDGLRKAGLPE
jgi:adenylate cyclase